MHYRIQNRKIREVANDDIGATRDARVRDEYQKRGGGNSGFFFISTAAVSISVFLSLFLSRVLKSGRKNVFGKQKWNNNDVESTVRDKSSRGEELSVFVRVREICEL